jgi:hypothetical protein
MSVFIRSYGSSAFSFVARTSFISDCSEEEACSNADMLRGKGSELVGCGSFPNIYLFEQRILQRHGTSQWITEHWRYLLDPKI